MGFSSNGTGFGHFPFGNFTFGSSNTGENMIIRSFPATYLEDDSSGLLLTYLKTISNSVNEIKQKILGVEDLVDPLMVREDILRHLGTTIDTVVDEAEPKEFARSLVNNAVLFYRIKGTEDSYRLRGKISGYDVDVSNLYHIYPMYVPFLDPDDVIEIPPGSGEFFTAIEPGGVSGIPTEAECGYCFTSFIKINFTVVKSLPPSSVNYIDRLIRKLSDIIPIHVRDVLYEIFINIKIDENQYMAMEFENEERLYVPMHVFHNFDVIPADTLSTDLHGYIQAEMEVLP